MRMFCLIALIGAPTAVALQPPTRQPSGARLSVMYRTTQPRLSLGQKKEESQKKTKFPSAKTKKAFSKKQKSTP